MSKRIKILHDAETGTAVGEELSTAGWQSVLVQITGTFVASVAFEGTVSGTWVEINAMNLNTLAVATVATVPGLYVVPVTNLKAFRANMTWTSGTSITVVAVGSELHVSFDGATGGGATEATLDSIKTAVELIDNAIDGTEMDVDVGDEVVVTVTPTLTVAGAYISGDYVGTSGVAGVIADAARAVGKGGVIQSVSVVDGDLQSVAGELWIFDTAVTPPDDNAAWSISDAHAATIVPGCPIPIDTYYASALNSIAPERALGIVYECLADSTDLYFCWVTRGAPTYVSGNLTFIFSFIRS